LRDVAQNEAAFARARGEYTYQQDFQFVELSDSQHRRGGIYRVTTDVTFTPDGKRFERTLHGPSNTLQFLRMTDEDFSDLRNVVPLVLTPETLKLYYCRSEGEQTVDLRDSDGRPAGSLIALAFSVSPRQMFPKQRYFEGRIWVDPATLGVVKMSGRAVPEIREIRHGLRYENLFGRFTTWRARVDGRFWFPVFTDGTDWLDYSNDPVEVSETVHYRKYRRFRSSTRIVPAPPQ
jgi:hypothetical protein